MASGLDPGGWSERSGGPEARGSRGKEGRKDFKRGVPEGAGAGSGVRTVRAAVAALDGAHGVSCAARNVGGSK